MSLKKEFAKLVEEANQQLQIQQQIENKKQKDNFDRMQERQSILMELLKKNNGTEGYSSN